MTGGAALRRHFPAACRRWRTLRFPTAGRSGASLAAATFSSGRRLPARPRLRRRSRKPARRTPSRSRLVNPAKPMPDTVTADEIKTLLKLEPNATCGFVRETYKSDLMIAPGGLPAPFADGRPLGTALYFMVTPEAPVKLHRIDNEQLYHYYLGDPIEVLLAARERRQRARRRRPEHRRRPHAAALHPGQHVPHRAHHRQAPLVPGREHRMAGRGPCGTEMSSLAMSMSSRRNIPKPPPTSATSPCRRRSSGSPQS